MHTSHYVNKIDEESFAKLLEKYDASTSAKASALDEERYVIIPKAVASRRSESFITKAELITLVEWKLSHGKFRPTLRGLVLQNDKEVVEKTTKEAFANDDIDAALKTLSTLRGIGPATASLLISVNDPMNVPFFSDELFRWCVYEDKAGSGWDRKIKYTPKEYRELVGQVKTLKNRLQLSNSSPVSAIEIEKVAYVLGREEIENVPEKTSKGQDKKRGAVDGESKPPKVQKLEKQQVQGGTRRQTRSETKS